MDLENKPLKSAAEIAAEGKTELESNLDENKSENIIGTEEIKANEIYDKTVKKQDAEKLTNLRDSMGLEQNPQEMTSEEIKELPDEALGNLEDIMSKGKVIEMNDIQESSVEEEKGIENTTGFQEAIASEDTAKAETWLESVKNEKYKGNDKWLDHRSGELYRNYRDSGDFAGAQRMIDILPDGDSKKGRIRNLKDIMNKDNSENSAEEEKGFGDVESFNEAMKEGRIEEVEAWVSTNKEAYSETWLEYVSDKLFEAFYSRNRLAEAKKMVEILPEGDIKKDRKAKLLKMANPSTYEEI